VYLVNSMAKSFPVRLLRVGLSAALLVAPAAPSPAGQGTQAARQKVDVSRLGPQVGQRVPDFSLKDQNGRAQNLQSIMGSRGAMLVFFRSADW
jgi:hypothetical protein